MRLLQRVVRHRRTAWPEVQILLRGDGHFSTPEGHAFCRDQGRWFVLGQETNAPLKTLVAPLLAQTQTRYAAATASPPVRLFTQFDSPAATWSPPLRVVAQAEVSSLGTHVRFVTTNRQTGLPSFLYQQAYAGRGQRENYLKKPQTFLHADRTSCQRFEANPFRRLRHRAAYRLLHARQDLLLAGTRLPQAYFDPLQRRLLKLGARVVERATVSRFHCPTAFPLQDVYRRIHPRLSPASG